jgi:hypothetical protein
MTEEVKQQPSKQAPVYSIEKKSTEKSEANEKPVEKPKGSFGMKGGFLLGGAKKPAKPKVEDVTHLKAQPKNENLKLNEVQNAMGTDAA